MSRFVFLKYQPTPTEKYLGIATILYDSKIVLRFKIVPKKEGGGYFPAAASYKIVDEMGSEDYISAFVLDSNSEKEEAEELIRYHVRRYLASINENPVTPSYAEKQYAPYPEPSQPLPVKNNAFPYPMPVNYPTQYQPLPQSPRPVAQNNSVNTESYVDTPLPF